MLKETTMARAFFFFPFFFLLFHNACWAKNSTLRMNLPGTEIAALKQIAASLGKNWNFSVNPCSGKSGWRTLNPQKGSENDVTCVCNRQGCHVTSILLKTQGLRGELPRDLSGLPYLSQLDLTRNYLNGPIPPEWGNLKLVNVSLMSNNLSGTIPAELGKMISLKNITLENNQLSGVIPRSFGNLTNLVRLFLSSNNLTGEIPPEMARLTGMTDFRLSDTGISGRLPDFIGTWTNLTRLTIMGTDFEGPIPLSIGNLTNLVQLMITDIKGTSSVIPSVGQMKNLKILILSKCNLSGQIPDDIGLLPNLEQLDLSFNMLSGTIPDSLPSKTLIYMLLNSNNLTGPIPGRVLQANTNIDLSYNNFTGIASNISPDCQQKNLNLLESFSSTMSNQSNFHPCLKKDFPCTGKPKYSFLSIDCGSKSSFTNDGVAFESDGEVRGAATVFMSPRGNWAMGSTGTYLDNNDRDDDYIALNSSVLYMDHPEIYMTARRTPLSLKYYGLCLWNGPYTVKLHFAEIQMTDDKNFSSLGKRLFDVYIQGKLAVKNFNIKEEANGTGKAVVLTLPVNVTTNTLTIHFFWAGKGTTVVPIRGIYGPLVSAISVKSDFQPPAEETEKHKKNISLIVIEVVIAILVVLLIGLIIYFVWFKKGSSRGNFTYQEIKRATKNFDESNRIGEGGFGKVYKGQLPDGRVVAIKKLSSRSQQGGREFINEIGIFFALQHENLVKLHGSCIDDNQLLLVYEFMENNSLSRQLFGEKDVIQLEYPARRHIIIGVARGLTYIHEKSALKIIHRDIKASNILLDKDLNAKISDFGLAKAVGGNGKDSTVIVGTQGYMAPEYAMHGKVTYKIDIYSFGILLLEIVSGQSNGSNHTEDSLYLLDWARLLQKEGDLLKLVDPRIGDGFPKEEVNLILNLALDCTNESPESRPDMSTVLERIEGKSHTQSELVPAGTEVAEGKTLQKVPSQHSLSRNDNLDAPWLASSSSSVEAHGGSYVTQTSEDRTPVKTSSHDPEVTHQRKQSVERSYVCSPCLFTSTVARSP